jgi:hypothetical protein
VKLALRSGFRFDMWLPPLLYTRLPSHKFYKNGISKLLITYMDYIEFPLMYNLVSLGKDIYLISFNIFGLLLYSI